MFPPTRLPYGLPQPSDPGGSRSTTGEKAVPRLWLPAVSPPTLTRVGYFDPHEAGLYRDVACPHRS